jgi:peroxin-6
VLGKLFPRRWEENQVQGTNDNHSAKELEHFERIRQTFEAVDKSKQDSSGAGGQTIAEAMEAFSMGESTEVPIVNGDTSFPGGPGGIHGRIKGLKQWPGGIVRSPSGSSISSGKGKGKAAAGKKGKSARTGGDSDASLDGDDETMADGAVEDDEDDYIVRTDHLANPMEEVE